MPMAHTGPALARHRAAARQGGAAGGEGQGSKAAGESAKPAAGGEAEEEDFHSLVGAPGLGVMAAAAAAAQLCSKAAAITLAR